MKIIFTLITLSIILFSCNASKKALRSGNYDLAIKKSIKVLKKKPTSQSQILILEEAYKKANEVDAEKIAFLKKEGKPSNYDQIYYIYAQMKYRQELLRPLPPLVVKGMPGRKANFKYINYDDDMLASKQRAAEYFYQCGIDELKNGDRYSARSAYNNFLELQKLYTNYKDLNILMQQALTKGKTHVLVKVLNKTNSILPPGFEPELLRLGVSELNSNWISFDSELLSNKQYHYYILLNLKNIQVMPDQLRDNRFSETKSIQDGYDYVKDTRGNVKKDSLGNDIKIPKYKTISCNIIETQQRKEVSISGHIDYLDVLNSNMILKSENMGITHFFSNNFAQAIGDLNALTPETANKVRGRFIPFPNTEAMILNANQQLKEQLKNIVWRNRNFLQ